MTFISTEGYLIRWYELHGQDRWFTFFTRDHGLLKVIAARRKLEQTPALAHPAPLDRGEILATPRRRHPGGRLTEYRLLERNTWLSGDLAVLGRALLLLEAVENLSAEEDPQPRVYRLLGTFLGELKRGHDPVRASAFALLKLFRLLGYGLSLDRCRACQGPPRGACLFQMSAGGFVHAGCTGGDASGLRVSPGTLKFLARMSSLGVEGARNLKGDRTVQTESGALLRNFLNYLCQKKLPSQVFLGKIGQGDGGADGGERSGARPRSGGRR